MLREILLIIITVAFAVGAYYFIQNHIGKNVGWESIGNNTKNNTLQVKEKELWGQKSPYAGLVTISSESRPNEQELKNEYISLITSPSNKKSINITGWSLQSIVSNTRIYIPKATLMLKMTSNNTRQEVYLAPGEYAIIHSGISPIRTISSSFHTNMCIGYISKQKKFIPEPLSKCRKPADLLPATPQNIRTYGEKCVHFINNADPCTTYSTQMPAQLLPACRTLLAKRLNYHSCLKDGFEKYDYNIFNNGGWYIYLNNSAELWRNNYEAIRLLDAHGRVVDVFKY